jgi:hypothetical protein
MGKAARVACIAAITGLLVGAAAYYVADFLRARPTAVAATTTTVNGSREATLTLQTVAALGSQPHPDWVSYLVLKSGKWQHSTIFTLPANALVHVTILQFDGASGLRNALWAKPKGVVGPVTVDGKPFTVLNPDDASHTFAVPDLGLSVPLLGVPDDAKNPCGAAPCATSFDHHTIQFSFRTGAPGRYRWQCFVPCAAGFIFGNGGPMQTLGYMGGFIDVV